MLRSADGLGGGGVLLCAVIGEGSEPDEEGVRTLAPDALEPDALAPGACSFSSLPGVAMPRTLSDRALARPRTTRSPRGLHGSRLHRSPLHSRARRPRRLRRRDAPTGQCTRGLVRGRPAARRDVERLRRTRERPQAMGRGPRDAERPHEVVEGRVAQEAVALAARDLFERCTSLACTPRIAQRPIERLDARLERLARFRHARASLRERSLPCIFGGPSSPARHGRFVSI
jgi:hypothetical protein